MIRLFQGFRWLRDPHARLRYVRSPIILVLVLLLPLFSCSTARVQPTGSTGIGGELQGLIDRAPSAESLPEDEIVNLLIEKIEEVMPDGQSRIRSRFAFKVLKEQGKEYADVKIGYHSRREALKVVYARTISPDGKILLLNQKAIMESAAFGDYPSYHDHRILSFSLPGVTIGSVVEYQFVREVKAPQMESAHSTSFLFQFLHPTLVCRYVTRIPEKMDFKYLPINPIRGISPAPAVTLEGGKRTFSWEYRDLPPIRPEASMPPFPEISFHVLGTTADSWGQFFQWWKKRIEGKTVPSDAIEQKTAELTRNLTGEREKIEAIFNYVKSEIRYVSIDLDSSGYEPAAARDVHRNKYGDCKDKSTLLISMLKAAGVSAHYVLVSTRGNRNLIRGFPFPFQFDHCIVAVEKEGEFLFLDPVSISHAADFLPGENQGRDVLVFKEPQPVFAKTPLATAPANQESSSSHVKLETDGGISAETLTTASGDREAFYRSLFIYAPPQKVRDALEGFLGHRFPGAKIVEMTHGNPKNHQEKFFLRSIMRIPNFGKKSGDLVILPISEFNHWNCSGLGKGERQHPIVIWDNQLEQEETKISLPEGYEVLRLPEPVEIQNPYFEFHRRFQVKEGKVLLEESIRRNAVRIPADEYSRYETACQAMQKSLREDLILKDKSKTP